MDSNLARLRHELEATMAVMTDASMAKAPTGKWSSAQILEHLFLTYKNTNRGLARCLETGAPLVKPITLKELGATALLRQRLGKLLVVNLGHMPGGATAPERARPQGMPHEEVRRTIIAEIQKMESGLDDCERRFGAATRIMDHPILGPLTARQWRKFHWVHGRHHAKQIRERSKL